MKWAVPCVILVSLLSSCTPLANQNNALTVVNSNPSLGTLTLDDEPVEGVHSQSYFTQETVTLRATAKPGVRAFFGGYEFLESFEHGSSSGFYVYDAEHTFRTSYKNRFVTARFTNETYGDAHFLDENRILYSDNRDARDTYRVMPVAGGNRSGPSAVLIASDQGGWVEASLFEQSSWVRFDTMPPPYSGNSQAEVLLWNSSSDSNPLLNVATLVPLTSLSPYDCRVIAGSNGTVAIIADGYAALMPPPEGWNNHVVIILDSSGRVQATKVYGSGVWEDLRSTEDRDSSLALLDITRYSTGDWSTRVPIRRELSLVDPTALTIRTLYSQTYAGLFSMSEPHGDFLFWNPTGSVGYDATEFQGFAPDGSGRGLFATPYATDQGGIVGVLIVKRDGTTDVVINLWARPVDAQALRWMPDSSGAAWQTPDGLWHKLLLDGTTRLLDSEPAWSTAEGAVRTVSPSGLWTLETMTTDGVQDVALRNSSSPIGTGTNLTIQESNP